MRKSSWQVHSAPVKFPSNANGFHIIEETNNRKPRPEECNP
jgi:hypothetical protein